MDGKSLIRLAAICLGVLGLMAAGSYLVGRPDWFVAALLAGAALVVLFVVGEAAAAVLPEEQGGPVRSWCLGATPLAIIGVGLLATTTLTPAMFTPDTLASQVALAQLHGHLEQYAGRKVRIEGELGGASRPDWDRYEFSLYDDAGAWVSVLVFEDQCDFEPRRGQRIQIVAVAERSPNNGKVGLKAETVRLLEDSPPLEGQAGY